MEDKKVRSAMPNPHWPPTAVRRCQTDRRAREGVHEVHSTASGASVAGKGAL